MLGGIQVINNYLKVEGGTAEDALDVFVSFFLLEDVLFSPLLEEIDNSGDKLVVILACLM